MPVNIVSNNYNRAVDISGNGTGPFIPAADNEPARPTYGFGATLTLAATPTDFLTIQGIAGKIIRIKSLYITGSTTSANGSCTINLLRRTVANTGGTSTLIVGQAHNPTNPASSAVIRAYTANPATLGGGGVPVMHSDSLIIPVSPVNKTPVTFDFSWRNEEPIVLNGASDWLCVNGAASTIPAPTAITLDCCYLETAEA